MKQAQCSKPGVAAVVLTLGSYLLMAYEINLLEQNSFCKNNKMDCIAVQLTKEE